MSGSEILVIRHGALGDLIQSLGPLQAIRGHHPEARITLLTTPAFADFMAPCPWIDWIWLDLRPKWYEPALWLELARRLRRGGFDRVYDLQTSGRSSLYLHVFPRRRRPEWSGIAAGASHFHGNQRRDAMHTLDRQLDQLRLAGIERVPPADLSWVEADVSRFGLPAPFALVVPGGSAHRPGKRWPADYYVALCQRLLARDILPVLIGGTDEAVLNRVIAEECPGVRDLAEQTTIEELAVLARDAALAVGNDTGPMHIAAVAGCPSLVLFSAESDPGLCAPRGRAVEVLRRDNLGQLSMDQVWAEAEKLLD
ncbi:MAG: glycosyltransferase family 9 protein [Alphaproteobacteria bacterium]|jgi:ADP-heptose:LPS heptosyltransferase|nr:glycosyltransferase family 9 protein [Alphaproteobacteria bacterium]